MEITSSIVSDFRDYYDQFSDSTKYSDKAITKALCKADWQTGSSRWGAYKYENYCGNTKALGLFSFAAHILSIDEAAKRTSSKGQIATSLAPVSGKSVSTESVSFSRSAPAGGGNGFEDLLNTTVYGQEFIGYRNAVSMSPVMV